MPELKTLMLEMMASSEKVYHVLDLFGASQKVSTTWNKAGYRGIAFDIKLCSEWDLCSESGFRALLRMSAQKPAYCLCTAFYPFVVSHEYKLL